MQIQHRSLVRIVPVGILAVYLLLEACAANPAASQQPGSRDLKWETGYISMKDGVKLAYILHKPEKERRFPVLVTYNGELGGGTPKGLEEMEYVARGYGILGVSVRGTGASEGVFTSPFTAQEADDGKAVVEWTAEQSWCDGNVGMYGNSYAGVTQLEVAAQRPKQLKALAVGGVWGDSYEEICYPGGIFNFGLVGQWSYQTQPYLSATSARLREFAGDFAGAKRRAAHPMNKSFEEMRAHPFKDEWWTERIFENLAPQIEAPTLIFQTWQDSRAGARGALRVFEKLKAPKRILLSNGGDTLFSMRPLIAERLRWFDRWLKGQQNRADKEPSVTIWFETRDPRPQPIKPPARIDLKPGWVSTFSSWPIPNVQWATFYLTADGKLNKEKPANQRESGERFYLYPAGTEIVSSNEMFSAPPAPIGSLVYRSAPLRDDLAIVGSPVVTLYAGSEQKDTDFMVVLHDVYPKNQVTYVQHGLLRASHRALDPKKSAPHEPVHPHDKALELTPGQVYEVKLALFPVAHVLRAGHSLELAIMAPPLGASAGWGFSPAAAPGLNTLYHSAEHPSKLELPSAASLTAQGPAPPFGSLPFQPARDATVRDSEDQRRNLGELLRSWRKEKIAPERQ
jgi:putative CocE/NonD family hydrolase